MNAKTIKNAKTQMNTITEEDTESLECVDDMLGALSEFAQKLSGHGTCEDGRIYEIYRMIEFLSALVHEIHTGETVYITHDGAQL